MKCNSVNPDYQPVCDEIDNPRFCEYCQGTSGLSREKEEKYLISLALRKNIDLPNVPKEQPSLLKKAVNFGEALIKHASRGFPIVSDEEFNRRMGICRECPFFNSTKISCSKCGCGLETKARWKEQICPESKW